MNRIIVICSIIIASVGIDQITKSIAVSKLRGTIPTSYLGDFFRLHYAENSGAMLGFGSQWPEETRFWVFTVAVGALLVGLLAYLFANTQMTQMHTLGLAFIAGGGVSNFLDRLLNDGHVVDFMNMGIGSLRTGIFNVADMLIMAGMGMILLSGGWKQEETKKAEDEADDVDSSEATETRG